MKKLGDAQIGEHIWIRGVEGRVLYQDEINKWTYVIFDHDLTNEEYAKLKDLFEYGYEEITK